MKTRDKAVELLRRGELVAVPTETVYGLAAVCSNPAAIREIFNIKQRPFFDPLIVHGSDLQMLAGVVATIPKWAELLAAAFWPGPLTLILPKAEALNPAITSGLSTVGIRVPRHAMTLDVLKSLGEPVAAPSANIFGRTSPTTAQHVFDEFGDRVFILDGGPCEEGLESTVLEFDEDQQAITILRPGLIMEGALRKILGSIFPQLKIGYQSKTSSPGHLRQHYQPKIPLFLVSSTQSIPEKYQNFGEMKLPDDPRQAARLLYSEMRRLSESGYDCIVCNWQWDRDNPDWRPIWDRLSRAAHVESTSTPLKGALH